MWELAGIYKQKLHFLNNVLFEMFLSKLLQIKKLYTWSKNNNQNQFLVLLGIP